VQIAKLEMYLNSFGHMEIVTIIQHFVQKKRKKEKVFMIVVAPHIDIKSIN